MTAATASWYCSRNMESPSAALNERPDRFWSYQSGRGYEPVMAVGSIMSCVTRSMRSSVAGFDGGLRDVGLLSVCDAAPDTEYLSSSGPYATVHQSGSRCLEAPCGAAGGLDGETESVLCFATVPSAMGAWREG